MSSDPHVERIRCVYVASHARLWRAILAFTGSRDIADDAVAEAFAQALRRGEAIIDPTSWVWRTAFRLSAGEMKRRRDAARGSQLPDLGADVPEPAIDLMRALRTLSLQQRQCVVVCDLGGHTAVEAARLLGTSAAVVRVQRQRARRRLRAILEDGDD